jgi:hypothetical protein
MIVLHLIGGDLFQDLPVLRANRAGQLCVDMMLGDLVPLKEGQLLAQLFVEFHFHRSLLIISFCCA